MTQPTTQIKLTEAFNVSRFKGTYYLVGYVARLDKAGDPFWEITLSDAGGNIKIYCRDEACIYSKLTPQSLVDVEVRSEFTGTHPHFRCKFIQMIAVSIENTQSLSQLPASLCPIPYALTELMELVESISTKCLRDFVKQVLLQPSIGIRFIQCPGSLNHHHNYEGGLLMHCLEVASRFAHDDALQVIERELGIVASLLHDIGKTQTLTPNQNRSDLGFLVDHNQLTLEVCAPALHVLAKTHQGHANHLRHVWTCASEGARYGFKAKTPLAHLLKTYDRASAFATNHSRMGSLKASSVILPTKLNQSNDKKISQ
jgi:3'-5' exoribonuclease